MGAMSAEVRWWRVQACGKSLRGSGHMRGPRPRPRVSSGKAKVKGTRRKHAGGGGALADVDGSFVRRTFVDGMLATLPQPLVDDFAVLVPQLVVDDVPRLERRLETVVNSPSSPPASSAST